MLDLLKRNKLVVVLLLAILVRLAFLFLFADTLAFDDQTEIHGSLAYDTLATNLLQTGVYGMVPGVPDASIPPLYSYVLALVYATVGRGFIQIALFHICLDLLSMILLYEIGRRLFREGTLWKDPIGEWVGTLAVLFYALYPYLIFQNLTLIDTAFFMLTFFAFVLSVIVLRGRQPLDKITLLLALLSGLILGLSTLARPITPFFAILVAVWFLFRLSLWQTLLRLIPVAILSVITLIPWTIRNYEVYDAFVPMSITSGANLWQGNSKWTVPVFKAGYDVQWTEPEINELESKDWKSREADSERFALAFKYLQEHADQIPDLLLTKFLIHWSIELAPRHNPQPGQRWELSEQGDLLILNDSGDMVGLSESNTSYDSGLLNDIGRPLHTLYFGSLLLLAILGFILSIKQWREVSLLWFVQISMTLVYLIFHPATRYRVPTDPLLFLFSAFTVALALAYLLDKDHRRYSSRNHVIRPE